MLGGLKTDLFADQGIAWSTNYKNPPSGTNTTGYEDMVTNPGGFKNQAGLRPVGDNAWSMQLSYGGIFGSLDNKLTDDLFNIGGFAGSGSNMNTYYQSNPKNTNFVQAIDSGTRFRWKEDPTETVYTRSTSISKKRLIKQSDRRNK